MQAPPRPSMSAPMRLAAATSCTAMDGSNHTSRGCTVAASSTSRPTRTPRPDRPRRTSPTTSSEWVAARTSGSSLISICAPTTSGRSGQETSTCFPTASPRSSSPSAPPTTSAKRPRFRKASSNQKSPGAGRGFSLSLRCSVRDLEVIRNAERNLGVDAIAVRREVGNPEVRRLAQEAAVLGADVEAGAELVGHARTEDATDHRRPLGVQVIGLVVVDRRVEHHAGAGFDERVIALERHIVDVGCTDLLVAGVNLVHQGPGNHEDGRVLGEPIVHLETTVRRQQIAIADQGSQRIVVGRVGSGRSMYLWNKVSGCTNTDILPAFLPECGNRGQKQRTHQHRLLHSSSNPFTFARRGPRPPAVLSSEANRPAD